MYEQPRYEPLEPSTFFENGASARPLVAGTVPRDDPRGAPPAGASEDVFYSGWSQGKLAETVPFPVDRAVLERGQERYRIYCIPCHGESGDGRGMIVRRGFQSAAAVLQRGAAQQADRPLLRRDDARLRDDVFLCVANPAARPMGDRGLYPGAPVEPARRGRRACRQRTATSSPPRARIPPGGTAMSAGTNRIDDGALRTRLDLIQSRAWIVAGVGLVVSFVGCLIWPGTFLPSYLVAYDLLGRDRPGLPGPDDAPPPGRRLVGPDRAPAHGSGGHDALAPGRALPAAGPGPVGALSLGTARVRRRAGDADQGPIPQRQLLPDPDRCCTSRSGSAARSCSGASPPRRTGGAIMGRASACNRSAGRDSPCCS